MKKLHFKTFIFAAIFMNATCAFGSKFPEEADSAGGGNASGVPLLTKRACETSTGSMKMHRALSSGAIQGTSSSPPSDQRLENARTFLDADPKCDKDGIETLEYAESFSNTIKSIKEISQNPSASIGQKKRRRKF